MAVETQEWIGLACAAKISHDSRELPVMVPVLKLPPPDEAQIPTHDLNAFTAVNTLYVFTHQPNTEHLAIC